jgi:hypothetical protein
MIQFSEWLIDPIDILLSEEHDPYELLGIPQNASYDDAMPAFRMKSKEFHHSNEPSKMVAINNLMDKLKQQKNRLDAPVTATATARSPYNPSVKPYKSPTADINDQIQKKVLDSPLLKGWSNKGFTAAQSIANMYKDIIISKKHTSSPDVLLSIEKLLISMARNGERRTRKLASEVNHYEDLEKKLKQLAKSQKEKANPTMNIGDITKTSQEKRPLGESFTTFKEWLKTK